MVNVLCPGSFDPVTNGHLDIFERAAKMFDSVTVAVLVNESKRGLFSIAERLDMLSEVTAKLDNVRIDSFNGLLVDYCVQHDIGGIVKGLRVAGDFDYEIQMAQMNAHLTDVDTIFLATSPRFAFVSSSLTKEVARGGGDVSALLPDLVWQRLQSKLD